MTMKTNLPVAVAFGFWTAAAQAQSSTDTTLVNMVRDLGFEYVEITNGPNQIKVEAIRGDEKYEVIYDADTGKILEQEVERADITEIGLTGVEIDSEDDDFLDDDDDDDDDDYGDDGYDGDEDDDDDYDDDDDDDEDDGDDGGGDDGDDDDDDDS